MFRFGELNVDRVRRILAGDTSPEAAPPRGKPPAALPGLPAPRRVRRSCASTDCIVAGDIGCYTLGVLPPFEAMDTCVCMGASIGVGLGLRHVLPPRAGAAGGQRDRRQHLRAQRHHRPGRDGLQPAADRPRGPDPRQRHHRHDRPAGAPRHRPHPGPRSRPAQVVFEDLARALGIQQRACDRPARRTGAASSELLERVPGRADELCAHHRAHAPASWRRSKIRSTSEADRLRGKARRMTNDTVTQRRHRRPGRAGRAQGLGHPGRRGLPRRATT